MGKKSASKNSAPAATSSDRKNGKANKKRPKVFDSVKRRLVNAS